MWYNRLSEYLSKEGYMNDEICPCIFIKKITSDFVILIVYVDDINLIRMPIELQKAIYYLKKEFEMKDLGNTKLCLGLPIEHLTNDIFVHQSAYTEKVLKRFYMDGAHSLSTPMVARSLHVNKDPFRPQEKNEELLDPEIPYLSAIGALMYLANTTRPEIDFSVNLLARRSDSGIDFSRKRLLSKKEEKTSTNVHEAKVDYVSQLSDVDEAKVDYTSQLPDDVLSSILSHMTIKDVVKTSILSTRLEEIDLQATKLHEFECFFNNRVRFYFSSIPVLEHVKISLREDASMSYIFGEFTANLPAQVKSLIVTAWNTQVTHFPTEMQIFRNLRMLVLLFESTYNFDIVKVSPILDACPVLQSLHILQHKTYRQKAKGSPISVQYILYFTAHLMDILPNVYIYSWCQGSGMMAKDNSDELASPVTSMKNDSMAKDNTDELVSPVTSVKNDSMAEDNIDELVSPVTSVKNDSTGSKPDKISTINRDL
ncbi:hypothetical protein CQW23_04565 [Capsicum baccatum]|uniref:F-box domain-containing protein n=1 Tax=Capsicum baccatum TaxID=33114 RepID=A0A2G2XF49_CAPBA|nr:hypothetical protein CQW23_04565 [Capsicum baccatum]